MTDHLDMFVDEGIESIDAINNGLLALEEDPTDADAIDAVFRHAHTLKGNGAALGMAEFSELAHTLEDLLDQVRRDQVTIDSELMDEIFAAVDVIEAMLRDIDRHGDVRTDTGDLVDRLAAHTDDTNAHQESLEQNRSVDAGNAAARVTVGDGGMLGVDASFVLTALENSFEEMTFRPGRGRIEQGEFDGQFEIQVTGDPEALADVLAEIPQVQEFELVANSPTDTAETDGGPATVDTDADQLSSVRVDLDRLVELNELVEQLVTSRIRINREFEIADIESDATRELEKVSQRLRDVTMEMQLVPFDTIARGFPRIVRDTARELDKEIDFDMHGTDVEVDRRLLTRLKDPLIHVIRNAIDHGIESPADRTAREKPPTGHIAIDVRQERDQVVVEVRDDGGGIDVGDIKQRAMEEGIATEADLASMSAGEVYDLLFHAGFSTADEVTDVSGRGVGMDVVRDTVMDLDGSVTIDSTVGEGTTVEFRLPVTMAVADVMLIQSDDRLFGVPIADIDEVSTDEIRTDVHGEAMAERQDHLSPIIDLQSEFTASLRADGGATGRKNKKLVLIRPEKRDIALSCDAVVGQEEVVVKPLADILSGTPGVSGTAVLGDQQLVPIIDVGSI